MRPRASWRRTLAAAAAVLAAGFPAAAQEAPPAGAFPAPSAAAAAAPAAAPAEASAPRAPAAPVHVTAEEAEYRNNENLVIFRGKVVAVQGDTTLTADRMEVRFTPAGGGSALAAAASSDRRITAIAAIGSVTFRQLDAETGKERYATGERGDYDAAAETLTMTGAPRLWEGKNVLTGERIVFHLDTRLFTAQGKVNMTVFPEEKPGGGGPPR